MFRPPVAFRSPGRQGYAVQFSPYLPQRLAVAASQHFGIAGKGSLFVIDVLPAGAVLLNSYEWTEGLFDLAWSECNKNIIVCGSGDGSVQIWDTTQAQGPVKAFKEHTKEVYSVQWSQTRDQNLVVTASWDKTAKLWDPNHHQSLATFAGHQHIVYSAMWSPHVPGCFATASGDHTLRLWDMKSPQAARMVIPATNCEIITCDWCKYDKNLLLAGSVDGKIRGFDLRNPKAPVFQLGGHSHAIRRIKCSPHKKTVLASCSYDFTVRTWDFAQQTTPLETIEHHTEFVCGLDFNLHIPGQLADCGWDDRTVVFTPKSLLENPTPAPP
ncbi:peroxisomal targeting signal 2 receptor-like [Patiria miniata]|uniref:Peroxin-7 n=1 Tax=Patiria miniata TaxID=46514 RepID=A0A914A5U8_PATMI|nr:peroxisomal targeting signal 2 receptor-like [Patiria miniata]XP_038059237.1 peroxisomal targeting signal 2 receptor-like [Patiria miniata]